MKERASARGACEQAKRRLTAFPRLDCHLPPTPLLHLPRTNPNPLYLSISISRLIEIPSTYCSRWRLEFERVPLPTLTGARGSWQGYHESLVLSSVPKEREFIGCTSTRFVIESTRERERERERDCVPQSRAKLLYHDDINTACHIHE